MKRAGRMILAGLVILTALFTAPMDVGALTINFDSVFNGGTPTSTTPWLVANFTQDGADVILTLMSHLDVASEFISLAAFNIDPAIDLGTFGWSRITPDSTGPVQNGITWGGNTEDLEGGGNAGKGFDLLFDFPPPGDGRLDDNLIEKYRLTAAGLTPGSFEFVNSSNILAAAHVQGIPGSLPSGAVAGHIPTGVPSAVPEPATMLLLGSGLIGCTRIMRKKFKK